MNFWQKLPNPFFAVAPMADVTDAAFRRLIASHSAHRRLDGTVGGPDVMWTEFVSADGLVRATPEGKRKLLADLLYTEAERPIVAQLFSSDTGYMEYAAALCRELGFDGVDINMGCPDRSIEKQGCGAAMIKQPALAAQIIDAAKRGARMDTVDGIPVSVKTRLGYNQDELETWIPHLLMSAPAALTVHARTRQDMSKVAARWERIARVVELRDHLQSRSLAQTRIIGNGDVLSREDGLAKMMATGADGAMVGRALFGNPWFFHPTKRLPLRLTKLPTHGVDRDSIIINETREEGWVFVTLEERLQVLIEHTKLFCELLPHKSFSIMKKHFKAYVGGFPGAVELRHALMAQESVDGVEQIISKFLVDNVESKK